VVRLQDVIGRVESGTETESNAGAVAEVAEQPCLPAWLCEIIAPARPALAIFVHTPQGGTEVHARQLTKGAAISSIFHYASQANTTAWTQDDSMEGGGRERLEHVLEVERIRRQSRELLYTLLSPWMVCMQVLHGAKNRPNCGF